MITVPDYFQLNYINQNPKSKIQKLNLHSAVAIMPSYITIVAWEKSCRRRTDFTNLSVPSCAGASARRILREQDDGSGDLRLIRGSRTSIRWPSPRKKHSHGARATERSRRMAPKFTCASYCWTVHRSTCEHVPQGKHTACPVTELLQVTSTSALRLRRPLQKANHACRKDGVPG